MVKYLPYCLIAFLLLLAQLGFTQAPYWTQVSPKNEPLYTSGITLLQDGRILITGGYGGSCFASSSNTCEIYDPATDTWDTVASMRNCRNFHTATLLNNGKVLIAAGFGTGSNAEVYDPSTNTWTSTAPMNSSRQYHTATLLKDGRVLVVGGALGGATSCEIYDPNSNSSA